jgi:hypothetical protein
MKLYRGCDIVPDDTDPVCRQARMGGAVLAAMVTAAFLAGPIFLWWVDGPKFLLVVNALLAVFIGLYLIRDLRARFSATNWVLWIRPDGLWINLRAYQDRSAPDSLSVVEFAVDEIAAVWRRTERYSIPAAGGRTLSRWLESLDVELGSADTAELSAALAALRRASGWRAIFCSVSLPAGNLVRIAWRGGPAHAVTPKLPRILEVLSNRLNVAEPVHEIRPVWSKMTKAELDDQILELVNMGHQLGAIQLLRRYRGMSQLEARAFVEELSCTVSAAGRPPARHFLADPS